MGVSGAEALGMSLWGDMGQAHEGEGTLHTWPEPTPGPSGVGWGWGGSPCSSSPFAAKLPGER